MERALASEDVTLVAPLLCDNRSLANQSPRLRLLRRRHSVFDGARMECAHSLCAMDPPVLRSGGAIPPLGHQKREILEHVFVLPVVGNRFHLSPPHLLDRSNHLW